MDPQRPREDIRQRMLWPIFLAAFLIIFQAGVTNVLQVLTHTPTYPVDLFAFGGDLNPFLGWPEFFTWGDGVMSLGPKCEWNDRMTHPPFFKQLLTFLPGPYPKELYRFFWGNVVCIFASFTLATYLFFPLRYFAATAAILAAALMSHPVLFLLDRGNIDGWVALFIIGGIFGVSRNRYVLAGTLITFAIASKAYPVVLLAPLCFQLQGRTLLWTVVSFIVVYLTSPEAWNCWFTTKMLPRWQQGAAHGNGSLLNTVAWILYEPLATERVLHRFFAISIVAIVGNLILDALSNRKWLEPRDRAAWLLMYLPLMVSYPKTVYHYCFWSLLLLPFAYAHVITNTSSRMMKCLVVIACVGVALSQFPVPDLYAIQRNGLGNDYFRFYGFPGLGALILLFCHLALKVMWLYEMPSKAGVAQGKSHE